MNEIGSYEHWNEVIEKEPQLLLFVKTDHCSVCEGLYPQVEALADRFPFPFYQVNAARVPELAGQLSLFTAPVVLLYHHGKEIARFARFVQMDQLTRRMQELVERGKEDA
ncbi:hypothetical protein NCCP2222_35190 [Sporosarcina sp. NCCP-2222]|uniref:thioredoxin family protein n=1 Tax=Sporosarcina sp. NCCP-2222 TaxID=2935073 RepID=UPI00208BE8A3|nr:thioredoxin family protein [Sporosarcina sp. NCCP-2222]GKV57572.1 hypothetical protein NCCP2222_35190 [Sporosarcina sp. NCCP-2222]